MSNVQPQETVYQCLTDVGDGTGVRNAIGNYASEMFEIFISNPDRSIQISSAVVGIRDSGLFRQDRYAAMSTPLTNGIRIKVKDDQNATLLDLTAAAPIKTNGGWQFLTSNVTPLPIGAGDGFYTIEWEFSRLSGSELVLEPGHRLSVELNDSFEDLIEHTFFVYATFVEGG